MIFSNGTQAERRVTNALNEYGGEPLRYACDRITLAGELVF